MEDKIVIQKKIGKDSSFILILFKILCIPFGNPHKEDAFQCLKLLSIKCYQQIDKQAVERCKEVEMFINLFEGLLQFNHMDASQLARKQDCSKVSDWKASHSSLGKKFGGGAEKPQRPIPKYLSYDLYSAAIPSLKDNSGKDDVRVREQNAWARASILHAPAQATATDRLAASPY